MTTLEMQKRLRAHGFDPGPIDGIMGPLTEAAIIGFKRANGLRARAYVGPLTLAALGGDPDTRQRYDEAWMNEAARHLGVTEIPGRRHHPAILRWGRALGAWWHDDETPWCGTFAGWCLHAAGVEPPKYWMRARAYSKWGQPCSMVVGAVAVFERRGGGHVGFVVGQNAANVYVLGGNQRNQVNIAPIARDRLIGCRWPAAERLGRTRAPEMHGGTRTVNEA
jgi:uncharacterized protein (TIGR02594 family)